MLMVKDSEQGKRVARLEGYDAVRRRAEAAELAIKTAYYYLNSISQGLFGGVPAAKEVLRKALEGKGA